MKLLAILSIAALWLTPGASAQVDPCGGSFDARYEDPVTVGFPAARWSPHDLGLDGSLLEGLESLSVSISWTNAPTGGADFGIGVGGDEGFRYWNQQYQTTAGEHTERRTWDRSGIEAEGWHERDRLAVGPSVSTGQFAAEGIPYRVEWQAMYRIEGAAPCFAAAPGAAEGPAQPTRAPGGADTEGPDAGAAPRSDGLPPGLLPALLLVGVVVAVLAAAAASKGRSPPDEEER